MIFIRLACIAGCIALLGSILWANHQNLQTRLRESLLRSDLVKAPLTVAFIADLHVQESPRAYRALDNLIDKVLIAQPDLVILAGDYTDAPADVYDMYRHQREVANRLARLSILPIVAVPGNYETWSDTASWKQAFAQFNLILSENQVDFLTTDQGMICIVAYGDHYTDRFENLSIPKTCNDLTTITVTHDPAAVFAHDLHGLILAGHTHCGQVNLPLIGAPWTPSTAPEPAICGRYQDNKRTLYVTSGVGHSLLPIRLGTSSEWDLLHLKP